MKRELLCPALLFTPRVVQFNNECCAQFAEGEISFIGRLMRTKILVFFSLQRVIVQDRIDGTPSLIDEINFLSFR